MTKRNVVQVMILTLGACLALPTATTHADCGSVPFSAPALVELALSSGSSSGPTEVKFDPLQISVFEPKQRALILWNGDEEILLLSTDQRASQPTAVLEVIPLPAEPKVRLGDFKTFEKAQKLMVEKRMWACAHGGAPAGLIQPPKNAGKITFHKKLGAHNLTVAKVLNPDGFVDFVRGHLKQQYGAEQAPIRPEFVRIIKSYLDDGFKWFAFDVIVLSDTNQSRRPIEYRFKSDAVFYPMRISNLERGKTNVEMLVFTAEGANKFAGLPARHFKTKPQLDITAEELGDLDETWKTFFKERPKVVMDQWEIGGDISTFVADVKVR